MNAAYRLAEKLKKYPAVKRHVKNAYQNIGSILSNGKTTPDTIKCISSKESEHLFGYYDKSPWCADETRMIYLRVQSAARKAVSDTPCDILLKNMETGEEIVVAQSHAWNVQQGCMLQWLGPDFNTRILYNDFRNDSLCSVIYDIVSGTERVISRPVYSVSQDGRYALSLDFLRLNTFRPGYGYCNIPDPSANCQRPEGPSIWKVDLETNKVTPILEYQTLFTLDPRDTMDRAYHKINHIMIAPSGKRFMFLHRWILDGVKYDRLLTCDMDGRNLYNLLDEDMVSHSNWKDDNTILTFAHTYQSGNHYYLLNDQTDQRQIIMGSLTVDGHPSFSPDGHYIITDTYPDFKRKQRLYLYNMQTEVLSCQAEIFASIAYKNETRCDLHPRWSPNGSAICFDGAQEKLRQVYVLPLALDKL